MRDYELVMIVSPEVADEALSATIDRVQQFVVDQGGQVKEMNPWGRRKLAYPIRRYQEGNYVVAQISLEPPAVAALENSLELSEDVIRHLVVKLEDSRGAPPRRAPVGAKGADHGGPEQSDDNR